MSVTPVLLLLAGGLGIVILAVVIAVVASVTATIAATQNGADE